MLSSFILLISLISSVMAGVQYVELRGQEFKSFDIDPITKMMTPTSYRDDKTVLGSLSKLYLYSYIKEKNISVAPFTCKGLLKEESFCCQKGETINLETALKRSCGLFFENRRIGIRSKDWKTFWVNKNIDAPWLLDFKRFGPQSVVTISELLISLQGLSLSTVDEVLRKVTSEGTGVQGFDFFGSYPRIKTFTWDHPDDGKKFIGGFAGYLPDKTFIFARGEGKSHEVISQVAPALEKHWAFSGTEETECVRVQFFKSYPFKKLTVLKTAEDVRMGPLKNEKYQVLFKNNKTFEFDGSPELTLTSWEGRPLLIGKFNLTQYVARVIEREFSPREVKASEALSIVARTYLYQNAKRQTACYDAPDSSSFQRVGASKPSPLAQRIASKTADLLISEKNVMYHSTKSSPGRISWTDAVTLQNQHMTFSQILNVYYPNGRVELQTSKNDSQCSELPLAMSWLSKESIKWRRLLLSQYGFELPDGVRICQSTLGSPYLNHESKEIYIEQFSETEDLISIAHEWLHLAFSHHPLGKDEKELDQLARRIVLKGSL
jgi:uncharacterized protein YfaQ (DUF2300 family)